MKTYTQAELDELIGCPKRISEPPKRLKPEKRAARTEEFASWQEALSYFLRAANIDPADAAAYFPDHRQERFPFAPDERAL